jgi:hypothetical protein
MPSSKFKIVHLAEAFNELKAIIDSFTLRIDNAINIAVSKYMPNGAYEYYMPFRDFYNAGSSVLCSINDVTFELTHYFSYDESTEKYDIALLGMTDEELQEYVDFEIYDFASNKRKSRSDADEVEIKEFRRQLFLKKRFEESIT